MFYFLTVLIGLASGAAGAWVITRFTNIVDRFFTQKFDERMERFKHQLEREVEELRARLGHFTDRGVRSNELEYDAITAAWAKLTAAHSATNACIIRFHEYPNFNGMTPEQLERYMATSQLSEDGKSFVREAIDKNAAWARTEDSRLLNAASAAIREVHLTLGTKGIFIPKELEDEFMSVLEMCSKAWAFQKTEFSHGSFVGSEQTAIDFFGKSPAAMEALKAKVRARILAPYPNH